jgi:hypothetical protein
MPLFITSLIFINRNLSRRSDCIKAALKVYIAISTGVLPRFPESLQADPDMYSKLQGICRQCWNRDPSARPQMPKLRSIIEFMWLTTYLPLNHRLQRTQLRHRHFGAVSRHWISKTPFLSLPSPREISMSPSVSGGRCFLYVLQIIKTAEGLCLALQLPFGSDSSIRVPKTI